MKSLRLSKSVLSVKFFLGRSRRKSILACQVFVRCSLSGRLSKLNQLLLSQKNIDHCSWHGMRPESYNQNWNEDMNRGSCFSNRKIWVLFRTITGKKVFFFIVDSLSGALQASTMLTCEGQDNVKLLVKNLQSMWSQEQFNLFLKYVEVRSLKWIYQLLFFLGEDKALWWRSICSSAAIKDRFQQKVSRCWKSWSLCWSKNLQIWI